VDKYFEGDDRSTRGRMLAGDPYIAGDPELAADSVRAIELAENLTALDVAPIAIGDDVQIGPNVQLLTPTPSGGAVVAAGNPARVVRSV
jgi:maltose O-acetyltransferase